jgi:L-ascorbate metabolism protein UlaG (beta-lactamase superfamily)
LGDLGHVLSEAQIKAIGAVDILMIPVGGRVTLGAAEAVQVVGQLKPKVVLPMHYKPANIIIPLPIAGVEDFTKLIDWKTQELKELDVDSTTVTRFNHQVIVLANNS